MQHTILHGTYTHGTLKQTHTHVRTHTLAIRLKRKTTEILMLKMSMSLPDVRFRKEEFVAKLCDEFRFCVAVGMHGLAIHVLSMVEIVCICAVKLFIVVLLFLR